MKNLQNYSVYNFLLLIAFTLILFSCKDDEVTLIDSTIPVEFERALLDANLPYELDGFGGAYHPNQLVVKFKEGVSAAVRNDILINLLGAASIKECMCGDVLTLTTFDQSALDGEGGLEGIKQRGTDENEIEEITFNYYNFNEILTFTAPVIVGNPFENQSSGPEIIAVIDVGVDYGTPTNLINYLYGNNDEANTGNDDDGNCLEDDLIGWDFINEDNDPTDDHGHGTHVANIIIDQIEAWDQSGALSEDNKIMPLKTHNEDGIGSLFAVSCAIIYAADKGADVINASWGFYAEEEPEILKQAIEYAFTVSGAIFVTSMGNQNINLNAQNHYPSNLNLNNIIAVGAVDGNGSKAEFSNYYTDGTDNIFAPGVNIESTMPTWYSSSTETKSGTSMAAAFVTASVIYTINKCGFTDKTAILNEIKNGLSVKDASEEGNSFTYFDYNPVSFTPCP